MKEDNIKATDETVTATDNQIKRAYKISDEKSDITETESDIKQKHEVVIDSFYNVPQNWITFAENHFIKQMNQTKSYQEAFDCKYSTAKTNSSYLKRNPNFRKFVNAYLKEIVDDNIQNNSRIMMARFWDKIHEADVTLEDYRKSAETWHKINGLLTQKVEVNDKNKNVKTILIDDDIEIIVDEED